MERSRRSKFYSPSDTTTDEFKDNGLKQRRSKSVDVVSMQYNPTLNRLVAKLTDIHILIAISHKCHGCNVVIIECTLQTISVTIDLCSLTGNYDIVMEA